MAHAVHRNDEAVSPVIGIMLMLVVTIIIAAVVSGFAGGLAGGTSKAPQVSLTGSFSQSSGLIMTHAGGDNLLTTDLQVLARKSDEFGSGQSRVNVIEVNTSTIKTIDRKPWKNADRGLLDPDSLSWQPGESMFIFSEDIAPSGLATGGWVSGYGNPGAASIMHASNIGKTFAIELYTKDGKMIASTSMVIQP